MKYILTNARPDDYDDLIELWEASVRASHDFLSEADIMELRPQILSTYFSAVALSCIKDTTDTILGFSGVADGKLEMLFVAPEARGQGIGKTLCQHAITQQHVHSVDVNEQNQAASAFYQHLGFKIIARSPLDPQGKPYPILHLSL